MTPLEIYDIPGDKSISHRAIIIGALTSGVTTFNGFLCSEDCLNTLKIFRQLGVKIELKGTQVQVHGTGVTGLKSPSEILDVGNSGTGIRLIAGALSGSQISATLTGDHSIQKRPMGRILEPLLKMGASITANDNVPPLNVQGSKLKANVSYKMPIASAQVKSAVLLAACASEIPVTVIEPELCRDHTERMLRLFGATVQTESGQIKLVQPRLTAPLNEVQIPSDISSALFFICLTLMKNRNVIFKNIGLNESRIGCLAVLEQMGVDLSVKQFLHQYEPMGDIHIHPSSKRKNIEIPEDIIPNVIDELPILSMLALTQPGTLKVRGAEELRVKESDRIAGICRLATALGADVVEYRDGFDITAPEKPASEIKFDAHYDHRLAMSALIITKAFNIKAEITGLESISTSFPNFSALLEQLF
ncbi:MAG: 3-phosphoshikimate 1-carboxyvinyltransferase [Candidatus Margulisiibacteriota bacterium]